MLERRQADAIGKVRQLTRRHVASSRKPSGVAVVRMSSSSRESRGPSPWPGRTRPSSPVTLPLKVLYMLRVGVSPSPDPEAEAAHLRSSAGRPDARGWSGG